MSRPGETDYGKGSFPRIWNSPTFGNNFEEIDWRTPEEQRFDAEHLTGGCAMSVTKFPDTRTDENQNQQDK